MTGLKIEQMAIKDALVIKGKRFYDERGFFEELYNEAKFEIPITESWKQINLAESKSDTLRGIHCSNHAKFVSCIKGEVYDVIVDLRPDSPTYLKSQGIWLNADDHEHVSISQEMWS